MRTPSGAGQNRSCCRKWLDLNPASGNYVHATTESMRELWQGLRSVRCLAEELLQPLEAVSPTLSCSARRSSVTNTPTIKSTSVRSYLDLGATTLPPSVDRRDRRDPIETCRSGGREHRPLGTLP